MVFGPMVCIARFGEDVGKFHDFVAAVAGMWWLWAVWENSAISLRAVAVACVVFGFGPMASFGTH